MASNQAVSPEIEAEVKIMRDMEKEAYLQGNLLMIDFEDNFKYQQ